jgi:hypothetical protein
MDARDLAEFDVLVANPRGLLDDPIRVLEMFALEDEILGLIDIAQQYDKAMRKLRAAYFIRLDLLWPDASPWMTIRRRQATMSYLVLTRMTPQMLEELHGAADPQQVAWREGWADAQRTQRRPGPVCYLDAYDCMALALTWLCSNVHYKHLSTIFGMTATGIHEALTAGLRLLQTATDNVPHCRIAWPTRRRLKVLGKMVTDTYGAPPVPVSAGVMVDGFRLTIESPGGVVEQNEWYSGFTKTVCCNNVIAVAVDGTVVWANINQPGSMGDYRCANRLFRKCFDPLQLPPGHAVLADDAFSSRSTDDIMATQYYAPPGIVMDNATRHKWKKWQTMVRQGVEWAIGTIVSTWCRLRVPLTVDHERRGDLIVLCCKLHNFGARRINNHNQLKNVYLDAYIRRHVNEAGAAEI